MDPNTAFRHIALAASGCKATLRAENQNHVEHAERFQFWRQVLCREPLAGSPFYWEVEWTGLKVYKGADVLYAGEVVVSCCRCLLRMVMLGKLFFMLGVCLWVSVV